MGNSTSDIISRVSGMSIEELEKQMKQDLELLQDQSIVFSPKLASRTDLSKYNVPGGESANLKYERIPTDDEQSLLCSQEFPESAREKHEQVVKNLMTDISKSIDIDIASAEITKRLQAFCRVFEAILRVDEHKNKKSKNDNKFKDSQGSLPSSAKAAIKFGLSTLLNLIECVAAVNPSLYEFILLDANQILSEMPPLSMQTTDSTLMQSFNDLATFFDSVICGKISALSSESALNSFTPFFKLAISSGSLVSFLGISSRFLSLKASETSFLNDMFASLKLFGKMPPHINLFSWNTSQKATTLTIIQDSVIPTLDNNIGNAFLSHIFTSGKYYIEIIINKIANETVFGICDAGFNSVTAATDSSFFTIAYSADSNVRLKLESVFKFDV